MTPIESIEKLIKKINVTPRAQMHDKTLIDALAAQEKSKNEQSADIRPNIWRIIMKNRITKLSAAAVIIIAAILSITILDKSATPAYAIEQTIDAMKQITSVHIVGRTWDNELMDLWKKINPETGKWDQIYLKVPFGLGSGICEFTFISTPNISYRFNETRNIVRVFERQIIGTSVGFDRIFESIAENLDEDERMEIYHGKDPQTGSDVIMLLIQGKDKQGEDKFTKLTIDPETKLPLSLEFFGSHNTFLKRSENITYNEPIPQELLDFQIPNDAEVINVSEIEAMLDRPDAGIAVDNLTKKEASVLVAKEYWLALINKDWSRVEKLRPINSAHEWSEMKRNNPPVELLEVGQADWQRNCSEPVTPCIVKYADGQILEIKTYPRFREIDGKKTCVIGGTYGQTRQIEPNQL